MLLRPRPPSTAVDEGEAGADLEGVLGGLSIFTTRAERQRRQRRVSSARDWSRRRRDPDGSDATSPLNCCRGGVADYSSSVNCSGISRGGPVSASFSQRN